MSKSNISGSSISMNQEINVIGKNVITQGTKCTSYPPISRPTPDHSQGFSAMLPFLMGAVPASSGKSEPLSLAMAAVGAVCCAGGINISPDSASSGFLVSYANSMQYVTNGAYASSGTLNEEELKKLTLALLSQMLDKAGPGFSEWNQILAGLKKNAALADFLKGIPSAICAITGDPVNANTGNFIYEKEDLIIQGQPALSFRRFYNSLDKRKGCLGFGWRHNYEIQMLMEKDCYIIIWDDGHEEVYIKKEDGSLAPVYGCLSRLEQKEGKFIYQTQDGLTYRFGERGCLLSCLDRNGHGYHFSYNRQERLESVTNGCGSALLYQYDDTTGQLVSVRDHAGRRITLDYELGRLKRVTNTMGEGYAYYYDDNCSLYKIKNPNATFVLENKYDGKGRTTVQVFADAGKIRYDYQERDSRTLVTQQNGSTVAYYHDKQFCNVKTVYDDGEEQFSYNDRNQLIQRTDKNGNRIKYTYDDRGNKTQVIHPDGSKHNMTYDTGNRLLVLSVNGVVRLKNSYDAKGNLVKSEDALGRAREFRHDKNGNVTEIVQPNRACIYISRDKNGNIVQVTDADGNTTSYSYDELNRVIKTKDGNGNITRYQHDDCNRINKVTNAKGQHRSYEYTKNGKITRILDFNGASLTLSYNAMNQVASITFPDGGTRYLEYDQMQNVTKRIDPNGAETRYQYDSLNRLERVILANGGMISYEYDPNGNRIAITDANGGKTRMAYDEMNRMISATDPANACTEYHYDMDGNVIRITNSLGKSVSYMYNAVGKKVSETDILGNCCSYEYNEMGLISCFTDPSQQKTTYGYNQNGTLAKVTDGKGNFEIYAYDKNNNLIRRENQKGDYMEFSYDCLDQIVRVSSSFGQEQRYSYDAAGNVTSVTDTLGNVTCYTYSLGGKLTSVLDAAGNRTEYAYDVMGGLATICQHEGTQQLLKDGLLTDCKGTRITQYQRNQLGMVTAVIDPLGFKETYTYDLAGQMVLKKDKDGYETSYTYTPTGEIHTITYADDRCVTLSYNPLRQLTEIKDWLGITTINLDDAGRTEKVKDFKGREISYRWSPMGQRMETVYPDGRTISYQYDDDSRLGRLLDGDTEIQYQYNEDGNLAEKIYPGGVHTCYSYNHMGALREIAHLKDGNIFERFCYEYDKMGNKTSMGLTRTKDFLIDQNMGSKLIDGCGYYQYRYDSLNRLTEVIKNQRTIRRFGYDAFGNRIRMETEGKTERYSFNSVNQLIETEGIFPSKSYQYDARGNLTAILCGKEQINGYVYDETNRLYKAVNAAGETVSYQYDGLGNRVGAVEYADSLLENPTKDIDYLLDRTKAGHNLLEKVERTGKGFQRQTYIWDTDVAFLREGDTTHLYLHDDMGSPVRLVEIGDGKHTVYGYDEFGQDLFGNQGETQPFGYTGYRKDKIANMYFAQAREYLPERGAFASMDKYRYIALNNAATINQYVYCCNNPVTYNDPLGFERIVVSGGVYKTAKKTNGQYYYEFIDAGIAQIDLWKKENPADDITWLVADEGWSKADRWNIEGAAKKRGVALVFISDTNELVDYFNGKIMNVLPVRNPSNATKQIVPRDEDLITDVSFFSHGLISPKETPWGGVVSLGYNYEEKWDNGLDFKADGVMKLNLAAFDNPITNFYSCNTGTAGINSLAQLWVNRLGGTAYAYNGTTYYGRVPDQGLCGKIARGLGRNIGGAPNLPIASQGVDRIEFSKIDE